MTSTLLDFIDLIILWIHIFTAIIFIGGSFFIWLVVYPESFKITDDEKLRTRIVGRIGKRFAYLFMTYQVFSFQSLQEGSDCSAGDRGPIPLYPSGKFISIHWLKRKNEKCAVKIFSITHISISIID